MTAIDTQENTEEDDNNAHDADNTDKMTVKYAR